ncbi:MULTISPECIES: bacteriocin immunity protein [unclassified Pseudomonas]|nr:bacteriocin immunity protein [uncultured Pseudomonas sp.]
MSEHPAGSDLIYYRNLERITPPEGVTRIVKDWRAAQGSPGFKGA